MEAGNRRRRPAQDRRARRKRHRRLSRRRACSPAPMPRLAARQRAGGGRHLARHRRQSGASTEIYRNAALVRQTALEFDSLQPQVVVRRLGPLAARRQRLARQRRRDGRHRLSEDAPAGAGRAGLRPDRAATRTCPTRSATAPRRWRVARSTRSTARQRRRPRPPGAAPPPVPPQQGKKPNEASRSRPRRSQPARRLRPPQRPQRARPRRPSASASRCSAPKARSRSIRCSPTIAGDRAGPIANSEWAQPGGNASKSMVHVALGDAATRAWSVSIGAGNSYRTRLVAEPVVADGRVYTIDTASRVRAFNADTGAWSGSVRCAARTARARPCSAAASAMTAAGSTRPTAPATRRRSTRRPATSSGW